MGHPTIRVAVIALAVAATLGVPGSSRSANSLLRFFDNCPGG